MGLAEELAALGAAGELGRLASQAAGTGGCAAPVRLVGHVDHVDTGTGEVRRAFSTDAEPGGVLRVRCNNRRATVCPACSAVYKGDARQIVLAGLAGGKGTPAGVAAHPAVFATLTAPSFGAVHSRRRAGKGGPVRTCRPRRGECEHGRALGCHVRHGDDDPRLGEPLCADCYDYAGQVVWNSLAARLWKRTRDAVESHLAQAAGLSVAGLRRALRITFVKVAEMQARGVVHFHAVVRVDGRSDDADTPVPPPPWATAGLVEHALRAAVAGTALDCPDPHTPGGTEPMVLRWGVQVDVRPVRSGGPTQTVQVGNYLAKYTTKSVDADGLLDRPVRSLAHLRLLNLPEHARRLVEACWTLGYLPAFAEAVDAAAGRAPGARCGLLRWAHAFGFGGHWVTKSRFYSTTFSALRTARREFARAARFPAGVGTDAFGRVEGDGRTVVLGWWRFAGVGLRGEAEWFFAGAAAGRAAAGGRGTGRAG